MSSPATIVDGERGAGTSRAHRLRQAAASGVLMTPGALLLVCMVAVPVLVLIWYSLLPGEDSAGVSLVHYGKIFSSTLYVKLFLKSLVVAVIVGLLTVLLAWPGAWALSRIHAARRQVLLSLVIVPYLTSLLLLIYAVFVLLGPGGPAMSALDVLGLASADSSIVYTNKATILMLVYENLPIMMVVLYSASERIDNSIIAAAMSLGAGPWMRFRKVVLPLSLPSLLTGFVLVFVPVGGSFVEADILGGPSGQLLGNVIADQLTVSNNPHFGASLSALLLIGILLVVGVLQLVTTAARAHRSAA